MFAIHRAIHEVSKWASRHIEDISLLEDQPSYRDISPAKGIASEVVGRLRTYQSYMAQHWPQHADARDGVRLVGEVIQAIYDDHGGNSPKVCSRCG